jgi:hypothetical protein
MAKDPVIEQVLASRLGTISSSAEPIFKGGRLTGCSVNFETLVKDFTYKAGDYSRVGGSFNFVTSKNKLGILLKVVVNDFDPPTYKPVPNPPVSAFFVFGNATSLPYLTNGSLGTDTPGAIVAVYDAVKTFPMLLKSVSAGTITVGSARTIGGMDMQVPIDLSIEDTDDNGTKKRSNKSANGFVECTSDLLKLEQGG